MLQDWYILVVDDEPGVQDFVRRNLELRSFKVLLASNRWEALTLFDQAHVVRVILNIMIPNMDGLEVCRRIRQKSTVPIIMLTALREKADKIAALDQGADDYLTKPFGVGGLLARVRAVLRRSHWPAEPVSAGTQRFGHLEINFEQRQVRKDGELVKLSPTEFALLQELALHPGKVLTHETLLRRVWGTAYRSETEDVRVYIGRLRRKMEDDPARPRYILTEPGIGYYMVE